MQKLLKNIDIFLSPPPNFVNFSYIDRFKYQIGQCLKFDKSLNCLRYGVHALRLGFMLLISRLLYPVAALLKRLGYRFVDIDLSQIGSILYLDILLREDILKAATPKNKFFILASKYFDGNGYILDLYANHVTLVRNPLMKLFMAPFFMSSAFAGASFRFDSVFFTESVSHEIWNTYLDSGRGPLISFPENHKSEAAKSLQQFLPADTKFVSLHVRDSGFYNNPAQKNRNANIETYELAIRYLIKNGYAVVRLGDKNSVDISVLQEKCGRMLFDYAKSKIKSEMMDCYLLSQCEFFIGLSSGPGCIPPLFGKNTVNVNWFNASTGAYFLKEDLTTFKKFRRMSDKSLVPFKDLFSPPFSLNPSIRLQEEEGIYLEDNSPEEILSTVREFVEKKGSSPTELQRKAKSFLSTNNWAFGARGEFSDTILQVYRDSGDVGLN